MQKNFFYYVSINCIYWVFYKLIILEIILRSKFYPKAKLLYSGWVRGFGFGDHIAFCLNIKKKVKKNAWLFCYSNQQFENALFFYDKKLIIKEITRMVETKSCERATKAKNTSGLVENEVISLSVRKSFFLNEYLDFPILNFSSFTLFCLNPT